MSSTTEQPPPAARLVPVALPDDVLRGATGGPPALVVRTSRGWAVLSAAPPDTGGEVPDGWDERTDGLALVEAMSLADLVAGAHGTVPEPDRRARRAARGAPAAEVTVDGDPRDEEIATLRRTVAQLEHALAARVAIERAIGVLAERHGTSPREAFEELRGRARSAGRPATDLAAEVLDGLPTRSAVPGQRTAPGPAALPGARPAGGPGTRRRLPRDGRAPGTDGAVPEARS